MDIHKFKKLPVMGILRGMAPSSLEPLLQAVIEAGLKTIEVTLNTDDAITLISNVVKVSSGKLTVGAGTVLDKEGLRRATDAGATFIVSPVLVEEVAAYCVEKRIPFFPGALTPTEIYRAWQAGAAMVKVFPASVFGPKYFKAVKGPFSDIKLMAIGGVTADNVGEYFQGGASAVAFGASIFRKEWVDSKDFSSIKIHISKFLTAVPKDTPMHTS